MNMDLCLSSGAFHRLRELFQHASGIALAPDKTALVASRLERRVHALGFSSFDEYCLYLDGANSCQERQLAVDLLTINETYFFREPMQFERLGEIAANAKNRSLRVWSAACSTGEEPFSVAMTLQQRAAGTNWSVVGTDLSLGAIETAQQAVYSGNRLDNLPAGYLQRYFATPREPTKRIQVCDALRARVQFQQHNLLSNLKTSLPFDVIFLRNVLIYFDRDRKQQILTRAARHLRPGGYLFLGRSEPLFAPPAGLRCVEPSVYQLVG